VTHGSNGPELSPVGSDQAGPVRTCVGCRARAHDPQLLRVVARGTGLQPDPRRRLSGRGAWVHGRPACLELALRRRAFERALRITGAAQADQLREYIKDIAANAGPPGAA
jgi:predicted RNA-binding protein YlxR (DUF448 family)